jgi:sulfur carrier protein
MEIIVNGESKTIAPGINVFDYVKSIDLDPETVVVEYDGKIIKRDEYKTCILADGGELELIRFIGGG